MHSKSTPNVYTPPKLDLTVLPYTIYYKCDGIERTAIYEPDAHYLARYITRYVKFPYFFASGVGLVEVNEEPLFGGWRCSPVPAAEVAKRLRERVHFSEVRKWSNRREVIEIDLYDQFAGELAGTSKSNLYFPELKGIVFTGHTTSDGRQLKRRGFDRRTGLFVMAKSPFRSANDERMAVAA